MSERVPTMAELTKEHAIILLRSASVELNLAATCLNVNSHQQVAEFIGKATANLTAATKLIYPENNPSQENPSESAPLPA